MNDNKDTLIEKYLVTLEQARARIDRLLAKADVAAPGARLRMREEVDDIRWRKDSLEHKLEDLKAANGDALKDLKAGAEARWQSLSNAVERAASRFG